MVLGISTDSPQENERFRDEQSLPYPLLSDTKRTVCMAYGACSFADAYYADRITYIIDELGIITKVYNHVDPKTHSAEVLSAL